MNVRALFTRPSRLGFTALIWSALPGIALAAPDKGPGRPQILMTIGLALLTWAAVFFLFRWLYGIFLDWNWPTDFALGTVIAMFLLSTVSIFLMTFLFLWTQPWWKLALYSLAAVWFVLLIFALVGRNRQSA